MKRFVIKVLIAVLLFLSIIIASLFLLNNQVKDSALATLPLRHADLEATPSPRIILVAGSNICFSTDSERIQDEFNIPVINMGIHAGLGLNFILKDVESFIKGGDIVVVIPEYEHFYNDWDYGNTALVSFLVDIMPERINVLDKNQLKYLTPFFLEYAKSKIVDQFDYTKKKVANTTVEKIYKKEAFNKFGDVYLHWEETEMISFEPTKLPEIDMFTYRAVNELLSFKTKITERGATCILLAPIFQSTSYNLNQEQINKITKELLDVNLGENFISERYKFDDDYFYNTAYHANKKGVDLRTTYLIEDLKKIISKN